MGTKYSQLTYRDRVFIETLLEQQVCPAAIARTIKHDRSTVGRDFKRGTFAPLGCYMAEIGQRAHDQGRRRAGLARRKLGTDLSSPAWQPILMGLRAGWSPQQIYGRSCMLDFLLSFAPPARFRISHETIYRAIFDMPHTAPSALTSRLLRRSPWPPPQPPIQVPLHRHAEHHLHPPAAPGGPVTPDPGPLGRRLDQGRRGKAPPWAPWSSAIPAASPCSSSLRSADAAYVTEGFTRRLAHRPTRLRKTLTYDRGTEMALTSSCPALRMPIFFCDPYSPWQRGTNENTNGLIRQYLPKGSDLSLASHASCASSSVASTTGLAAYSAAKPPTSPTTMPYAARPRLKCELSQGRPQAARRAWP